jgi:AcrR family transcriptional regulator
MTKRESGGWARRRAERTEAIVSAGLSLVVRHGIDGLTVSRLASAVGMTPGALYRYFDSKDAIISELNLRVITRWTGHFEGFQSKLGPDDGALVPLAVTGLGFTALAKHEPEALALIALTAADPRVLVPVQTPRHVPSMLTLITQIGMLIDAAPTTPGDGRTRAATMIFGLMGILQTEKFRRFDELFNTQNLARSIVRDLLLGWGGTPESIDKAMLRATEVINMTLQPE